MLMPLPPVAAPESTYPFKLTAVVPRLESSSHSSAVEADDPAQLTSVMITPSVKYPEAKAGAGTANRGDNPIRNPKKNPYSLTIE